MVEPKETAEQRQNKKMVSTILYFWGVAFIIAGIFLFFYPEKAEEWLDFDLLFSRIMAGVLIIFGISDFIVAKVAFGKSERV